VGGWLGGGGRVLGVGIRGGGGLMVGNRGMEGRGVGGGLGEEVSGLIA